MKPTGKAALNLHIARTYLTATDPENAKRARQAPRDEMTRTMTGPTIIGYKRTKPGRAFNTNQGKPRWTKRCRRLMTVSGWARQGGSIYVTRVLSRQIKII